MTSDTSSRALRAVALVGLFVTACAGTGPANSGAQDTAEESGPLRTGPSLEVRVTRVSDGDSFRAASAEGELEIRLLGINSPEEDECFGEESRDRLETLLASGDVAIGPWPGSVDSFGRQLALVSSGSAFVNLALIESGHAVARAQSEHGFETEFEAAERQAASAEIGLWSPDACGAASGIEIVIERLEADAPGDDRQNPNGEWVLIRNNDDRRIDLAGWTLRDESTRHRFDFGSVVLEPDGAVRVRTGCGDDDLSANPLEVFWCDPEPPVWNNTDDTAFLLDQNGNVADHLRND